MVFKSVVYNHDIFNVQKNITLKNMCDYKRNKNHIFGELRDERL